MLECDCHLDACPFGNTRMTMAGMLLDVNMYAYPDEGEEDDEEDTKK